MQTAALGLLAELEGKKSWDHTVFCSNKKRDQTHKLMLNLSSICPLSTRTSFSTSFLRQVLWIHASKLPGQLFSQLTEEYILHLVKDGCLSLYGLGTAVLVLHFW